MPKSSTPSSSNDKDPPTTANSIALTPSFSRHSRCHDKRFILRRRPKPLFREKSLVADDACGVQPGTIALEGGIAAERNRQRDQPSTACRCGVTAEGYRG